MPSKIPITILTLVIAVSSFAQAHHPLIGTWKIVSQKVTRGDSTTVSDLNNLNSIKVVSDSHVGFLYVSKADSTTTAFVAKITVSANEYTEEFIMSNNKSFSGLKANFKYKLDNNRWSIVGGFTFDNVKYVFDEVWEKIK